MAARFYGLHFQDQLGGDDSNDIISGWFAGNGADFSQVSYPGDGIHAGDGALVGDGAQIGDGALAGDSAHIGGGALVGDGVHASVGARPRGTDHSGGGIGLSEAAVMGSYHRLEKVSQDYKPERIRQTDYAHSDHGALLDDVGRQEHVRLSVRPANVIDMPFTPRLTKPTPSSEAWKLVFLVLAFALWISTAGTLLFFYMDRYMFG